MHDCAGRERDEEEMDNRKRHEIDEEGLESGSESSGTPGDTSQVPSPVHAESQSGSVDPDEPAAVDWAEHGAAPSGCGGPTQASGVGFYVSLVAGAATALLLCIAIVLLAREQAFFKPTDSGLKRPRQDETRAPGATSRAEEALAADQDWWSNGVPKDSRRRKAPASGGSSVTMAPSGLTSTLSESFETGLETANTAPLMSANANSSTSLNSTP